MSIISISIDDVKGIFKVLQKEEVQSIFDTRTLGFLKRMHDRYGTEFLLFCTYKHADYELNAVSDKYRTEFIDNSDWLRFGFHCYDEDDEYMGEEKAVFERKLNIFLEALNKCTGQKKMLNIIRVHKFQGNRDICRVLKDKGVQMLLCADDERNNYYLHETENKILNDKGCYFDKNERILFIKSCKRLEDLEDIQKEVKKSIALGKEVVSFFTHEWQLDREDIREKVEICCKMGAIING